MTNKMPYWIYLICNQLTEKRVRSSALQ